MDLPPVEPGRVNPDRNRALRGQRRHDLAWSDNMIERPKVRGQPTDPVEPPEKRWGLDPLMANPSSTLIGGFDRDWRLTSPPTRIVY